MNTYYGSSHILQEVSFSVDQGEVVALLGRNGVGKTTTLRSMMGLTPPKSGSIRFKDEEVMGKAPSWRRSIGLYAMPRIFLISVKRIWRSLDVSQTCGYWNRGQGGGSSVLRPEKAEGLNLSGGEKDAQPGKALAESREFS
jgi:branched-chain amino acid transport system ATP-binding protein